MVTKNTDGTFRVASLGIDVPDLDTLRKAMNEMREFNASIGFKEEMLTAEKAEWNFDKWRRTHLRKLNREIRILSNERLDLEDEDPKNPLIQEKVKEYDKLVRENESLMSTLRGKNHLKANRDREDRWRVKLIKLYGSNEDKASLEK